MSPYEFYLLAVVLISIFSGLMLIGLWRYLLSNGRGNTGILFLSFSVFTWAIIGLYGYFDPELPDLIRGINERVLSAFSNMFLVASLPFFPGVFDELKKKYPVFRNTYQWVVSVFVFFTIITLLFTLIYVNDINRIAILFADGVISLITLSIICWALYVCMKPFWKTRFLRSVWASALLLFLSSQIFLPAASIFMDLLLPFTFYGYLAMLFGIVIFSFASIFIFTFDQSTLPQEIGNFNNTDISASIKQTIQSLEGLKIGYNEGEKFYLVTLKFKNDSDDVLESTIRLKKLLKPFTNWVVFSLARKADTQLSHEDIATIKFRMVELWNKNADIEISQDLLFHNDSGRFELHDMAEGVEISNVSFLTSRYAIRESFKEFESCFSNDNLNQLTEIDPNYSGFWEK